MSALTLGGAAEEIFRIALELDDLENPLQELFKITFRRAWNGLTQQIVEKLTTDSKKKVRNAVKHLSGKDDLTIEADIQDEAVWLFGCLLEL